MTTLRAVGDGTRQPRGRIAGGQDVRQGEKRRAGMTATGPKAPGDEQGQRYSPLRPSLLRLAGIPSVDLDHLREVLPVTN